MAFGFSVQVVIFVQDKVPGVLPAQAAYLTHGHLPRSITEWYELGENAEHAHQPKDEHEAIQAHQVDTASGADPSQQIVQVFHDKAQKEQFKDEGWQVVVQEQRAIHKEVQLPFY